MLGIRVVYVNLLWGKVGHQRTCLGFGGFGGCMQPVVMLVLSQVTHRGQSSLLFIFLGHVWLL